MLVPIVISRLLRGGGKRWANRLRRRCVRHIAARLGEAPTRHGDRQASHIAYTYADHGLGEALTSEPLHPVWFERTR